MNKDQVYVVGIRAFDDKDYDHKIDILREMLMQYGFVTDVLDYEATEDDNGKV
jgi:hypothetical protein